MTKPMPVEMNAILLLLASHALIAGQTGASNVRFQDEVKDVYLLKQPSIDRRVGVRSQLDDEAAPHDDGYFSPPVPKRGSSSLDHHDNEVQSFLVLQLPTPYTSNSVPSNSPHSVPLPDFDQDSAGSTKFSVSEGGFESEGELDDGATVGLGIGTAGDGGVAPVNADTVHNFDPSVQHEFAARVLTFRVGRERPSVRVLVWRKSSTRRSAAAKFCINVYAFHAVTNEMVSGHCPTAVQLWPYGTCVLDLLLPLKWWTSVNADDARGQHDATEFAGTFSGHNRFTKVKLGMSAFISMSHNVDKAAPSSYSNFQRCPGTIPTSRPGSSSKTPPSPSYFISADILQSLHIFGDVELIYPSEYALLPLNQVVKVLVPTIDYYPGTTFTAPIFLHYEPSKLNNSSIAMLQLRARASGQLRIVSVEDVYPDWTVSYDIDDSGLLVTCTAYHRSISLNESWAGEVFVLVMKIQQGSSGVKREPALAQLAWSVHLVLDDMNEKVSILDQTDSHDFASTPLPSSNITFSTKGEGLGKRFGETVSTHVNVQQDRVDTLAVIGNDEIVNTAVITGHRVSLPIRVISISQGGLVTDVTQKSHCVAIDPASLKVSAECKLVYVDGTETKSNANVAIGVQYGSYRTVARYKVWYPEFPMDIWLADPVLHAVHGWTVPPAHLDTSGQKQPHFRHRRNNEQLRSRVHHLRSKSTTPCRQKFQESEVKIYARFRAVDAATGGQTYLGGAGRKVQLDLTQLARFFLRVKNGTVARLVHTKYTTVVEGLNEGRTEIQLKSPVQRHIYGSSGVETANEQVHLRSVKAEVITGLYSHAELRAPYPPIYNLAIYKSSTFFRRYQEGTVSLTLRYSDGHRTNLDVLDAGHYRLYVTTNGSVTVFPGTSVNRQKHSSQEMDIDGIVLLPAKILTMDDHADGAHLNVSLFPPAVCGQSAKQAMAITSVPVEFPGQRMNPVLMREVEQEVASDEQAAGSYDSPEAAVPLPSLEAKRATDSAEHDGQSYGNAPLLASVSVSIFAVAGVLFAACAVREGWITVKSFARSQCRQWRLLVPSRMPLPPLVFAARRRCSRRSGASRSSSSSSSECSADEDEEGEVGAGRKRRRNRRGNLRLTAPPECTESSVVSAENEFVWLRPMSMTPSSNDPQTATCNGGARSLNGDTERRSTSSRKSLNADIERRLAANGDKGRENAEYVVSESELMDCRGSQKRRGSAGTATSPYLTSSTSTVSSNSASALESRAEECCVVVDGTLAEGGAGPVATVARMIPAWAAIPKFYQPRRKMSDIILQGYQRCSYLMHEGATTLPSGWSGPEDCGSIGSPPSCAKKCRKCGGDQRGPSNGHRYSQEQDASDLFVQRLLSARSDPTVHIRPTPTTAEAAAAAVEAAKRQCRNNQLRGTPLANGRSRPQSFLPNQFRGSFCSAASSGGASSDIFWDSSTLGMNEAELRDYFSCLRESVT